MPKHLNDDDDVVPELVAAFPMAESPTLPPPPPPPPPPQRAQQPLLIDLTSSSSDVSIISDSDAIKYEWLERLFCKRVSVKMLRICCIMIGLYHAILSHFALFVMLMSLVHAEQMVAFLDTDIADHKEREGYYDMPMHASGVTVNTLRFGFAADLAASTRNAIGVSLFLVVVYAICSAMLLYGAIRYRAVCMLPWIVSNLIGGVAGVLICIAFKKEMVAKLYGDAGTFYIAICTCWVSHFVFWFVVYVTFTKLHTANKLTESATVAIPYAAKGKIPYHFCKENMYLGSGGYKHTVSDKCDPNYVV